MSSYADGREVRERGEGDQFAGIEMLMNLCIVIC